MKFPFKFKGFKKGKKTSDDEDDSDEEESVDDDEEEGEEDEEESEGGEEDEEGGKKKKDRGKKSKGGAFFAKLKGGAFIAKLKSGVSTNITTRRTRGGRDKIRLIISGEKTFYTLNDEMHRNVGGTDWGHPIHTRESEYIWG